MNAVDTNVLLYAHDPRDPAKQARAVELINSLPEPALLWQVACEYVAASGKLEPFGHSRSKAWRRVRTLQEVWTTLLPDWSILSRAERICGNYSIAFWDAMILAACAEGEVQCLYTEDFGAYPHVAGVRVVNPFH